jgi:hypothetical protein
MILFELVQKRSSLEIQISHKIASNVCFVERGAFKVMGSVSGHCIYDGIQAHPSNTASPKVYEMTKKFTPQLHLEQVQRCNIWPKRFHKDPPTDDNIGLYFFPTDDERYAFSGL